MASQNIISEENWKKLLEEWQSSGKKISVWCREHDIGVHVFYYWRDKLLPSSNKSKPNPKQFIELHDKPSGLSGILLEISGVKVHVAKDFDPACLISCLQALRTL